MDRLSQYQALSNQAYWEVRCVCVCVLYCIVPFNVKPQPKVKCAHECEDVMWDDTGSHSNKTYLSVLLLAVIVLFCLIIRCMLRPVDVEVSIKNQELSQDL